MQGVWSAQFSRPVAVPPAAFSRNVGINEMGMILGSDYFPELHSKMCLSFLCALSQIFAFS